MDYPRSIPLHQTLSPIRDPTKDRHLAIYTLVYGLPLDWGWKQSKNFIQDATQRAIGWTSKRPCRCCPFEPWVTFTVSSQEDAEYIFQFLTHINTPTQFGTPQRFSKPLEVHQWDTSQRESHAVELRNSAPGSSHAPLLEATQGVTSPITAFTGMSPRNPPQMRYPVVPPAPTYPVYYDYPSFTPSQLPFHAYGMYGDALMPGQTGQWWFPTMPVQPSW